MAQIGSVKLETQNSGVVDVPVFATGDSASGIYEFVRVETASGTGFIPVTDPVDATYPYLRVQSQNNGIVAVTDTAGSAIPDSVDNRWPSTEGSGSTITNSIGTVDLSLNFSTWATGTQYNGDTAPDFDGVDDYAEATNLGVNGQEATVCAWIDAASPDQFDGVFEASNQLNESDSDQWTVYWSDTTATELTVQHRSGNSNANFAITTIPDATQNQLFIAYAVSGDSGELWVYDANGQQANATGTGARGQTEAKSLLIGTFNGDYTDYDVDDPIASTTTKLTTSEIESVWQSTGPNA